MPVTRSHALDHHPSFRAVIAAAPPLADLARATSDDDLVRGLAIACGELVAGFTRRRTAAPSGTALHRRAWVSVRELDRVADGGADRQAGIRQARGAGAARGRQGGRPDLDAARAYCRNAGNTADPDRDATFGAMLPLMGI